MSPGCSGGGGFRNFNEICCVYWTFSTGFFLITSGFGSTFNWYWSNGKAAGATAVTVWAAKTGACSTIVGAAMTVVVVAAVKVGAAAIPLPATADWIIAAALAPPKRALPERDTDEILKNFFNGFISVF